VTGCLCKHVVEQCIQVVGEEMHNWRSRDVGGRRTQNSCVLGSTDNRVNIYGKRNSDGGRCGGGGADH
jgi:hypothetical protein